MSSYLPSELARLILGYLEENGFKKSSQTLLKEVPELAEFSKLRKQGKKINTLVGNNSLEEILMDFSATKDHVRECLKNHPATFRNVPKGASLYEQVKIITSLASSKRNKNQHLSLGVYGSGGQTTRTRWLIKQCNDVRKHKEQSEDSHSSQNLLMEVNATPSESLPGSNLHHPIQVDVGKNCDQGHLNSASSSPLGTPCTISTEFNENTTGQNTSFSVTGPYFEGTQQKRKGQAKRRSAEQSTASNSSIESEANFEKILKNLYENTALHEKIAENINKGLNTQGKLFGVFNSSASNAAIISNSESAFGPEGTHPSNVSSHLQNETVKDRRQSGDGTMGDVALIKELDHIVTGIITETTSDPVFENLIEEVFGTSSNPPLPSKKCGSCQSGQDPSVDVMSTNSRPLSTPIPPLLTSDKIISSRSNFCNMLHSPASSSSLPGFPTLDNQSSSNSQPPMQAAESNSGQILTRKISSKKNSSKMQVLSEKGENIISSVLSVRSSPKFRQEESDCTSSPQCKPDSGSLNVDKSNYSKECFISSKTNSSSDNSQILRKEKQMRRKQKTKDDEKKLGDQLIEEFAQFQSSRPDRISESEGSIECEKSDVSVAGEEISGVSSPEYVSSPVGKTVDSPPSECTVSVSRQLSGGNDSISASPKGSPKKSEAEIVSTEADSDVIDGSKAEDLTRIISNEKHTVSVPDCAEQTSVDGNSQIPFLVNESNDDEFDNIPSTDAGDKNSQLLDQNAPITIKSSTIPGLFGCSTVNVYEDNLYPAEGNDYYTLTNLEPVNPQGYVVNGEIHQEYVVYSSADNINMEGSSQYVYESSRTWKPDTSDAQELSRNDCSKVSQPLITSRDGICINGQLVETGPIVQQGAQIVTTPRKNTTTIILPPIPHEEIDSGCVISIGVGDLGKTDPIMLLQLPHSGLPGSTDVPQSTCSVQEMMPSTSKTMSVSTPVTDTKRVTRSSKYCAGTTLEKLESNVAVSCSARSGKKKKKSKKKRSTTSKIGRPKRNTPVQRRPSLFFGSPKAVCSNDIIETALSFALSSLSPVKITSKDDDSHSIQDSYEGISSVKDSSSALPSDMEVLQHITSKRASKSTEGQIVRASKASSVGLGTTFDVTETTSNCQKEISAPSDKEIAPVDSKLKCPTTLLSVGDKNHSPQLKALLSLSCSLSPTNGLPPRNAFSMYKSPAHISTNRGSQSTPRRKTNHVRVLDFSTPRKKVSPNKSQRITKGLKFSPPANKKSKMSSTHGKSPKAISSKKKLSTIAESHATLNSADMSLMENAEDIIQEDEVISQRKDEPEYRYLGKVNEQLIQDAEDEENFVLRIDDEDTCNSLLENSVEDRKLRGTSQAKESSLLHSHFLSDDSKLHNNGKEAAMISLRETSISHDSLNSQSSFCYSSNLVTPFKANNYHQTPIVLEAPTPFYSNVQMSSLPDDDLNTPLLQLPGSALKTPLIKDYPQGPYSSSSAGTSYYQPSEHSVTDSEGFSPSRLSTVYENAVTEEVSNHSEVLDDPSDISKGPDNRIRSMCEKKANILSPKLTRKEIGEVIEQEIEKQFSLGPALGKSVASEKSGETNLYFNDGEELSKQDSYRFFKGKLSLQKKVPARNYDSDNSIGVSDNEDGDTPISIVKNGCGNSSSSKSSQKEADACQIQAKKLEKDKLLYMDQINVNFLEENEDALLRKLEKRLEMGKNVVSQCSSKKAAKQNNLVATLSDNDVIKSTESGVYSKKNSLSPQVCAVENAGVQSKVATFVQEKSASESSTDTRKCSKFLETFGSGVSSSEDSESETVTVKGLTSNITRGTEENLKEDKKTKRLSSDILDCRKVDENSSSDDFEYDTDCVKYQLSDVRRVARQNLKKNNTEKVKSSVPDYRGKNHGARGDQASNSVCSSSDWDANNKELSKKDTVQNCKKNVAKRSTDCADRSTNKRAQQRARNRITPSDESQPEMEKCCKEKISTTTTGAGAQNLEVNDSTKITSSDSLELKDKQDRTLNTIISSDNGELETEGYVGKQCSISTRNIAESQIKQKSKASPSKQQNVRRSQRFTKGKRSMTYSEVQMSEVQMSFVNRSSKVKKSKLSKLSKSVKENDRPPVEESQKSIIPDIEVQEVVIEAKVLLHPEGKDIDVLLNPTSPTKKRCELKSVESTEMHHVSKMEANLLLEREGRDTRDIRKPQIDQNSLSETCTDQSTRENKLIKNKKLKKKHGNESTDSSPETETKVICKQTKQNSGGRKEVKITRKSCRLTIVKSLEINQKQRCKENLSTLNQSSGFREENNEEKKGVHLNDIPRSSGKEMSGEKISQNVAVKECEKNKNVSKFNEVQTTKESSPADLCSTLNDDGMKGNWPKKDRDKLVKGNTSPSKEIVIKSGESEKDAAFKNEGRKRKNETKMAANGSENDLNFPETSAADNKRVLSRDASESPNIIGKANPEDANTEAGPDLCRKSSPFSVWGKITSTGCNKSTSEDIGKEKVLPSNKDLYTHWSKCFDAYGMSPDVNVIDTDEESPRKQLLTSLQETTVVCSSKKNLQERKHTPLAMGCARLTPYLFSPERRGLSKQLYVDCAGEVHNITPRHRKRCRSDSNASPVSGSPSTVTKQYSVCSEVEGVVESCKGIPKIPSDTEEINSGSGDSSSRGTSTNFGNEITLHGLDQTNARVSEESLSFLDSYHVSEIEDHLKMFDGAYIAAATSAILSDTDEKSNGVNKVASEEPYVELIGSSLELKNDCLMSFKCLPSTPEKQRTEICHSLVKEKKALVAFPSVSKDCLSSPKKNKQLQYQPHRRRNLSGKSGNEVQGFQSKNPKHMNEKSQVDSSYKVGDDVHSELEKHGENHRKVEESNIISEIFEDSDNSLGCQPIRKSPLGTLPAKAQLVNHSVTSPGMEKIQSDEEFGGSQSTYTVDDEDKLAKVDETVMKNENHRASCFESSKDNEDGETCTLRYSDMIDIFSQNLTPKKHARRVTKKFVRKRDELLDVSSVTYKKDSYPKKTCSHLKMTHGVIPKTNDSVTSVSASHDTKSRITDLVSDKELKDQEAQIGSEPEKCKTSVPKLSPPRKKPRRIQPIRVGEVSWKRRSTSSSAGSSIEERGENDSGSSSKGKGNQSERSVCSWSSSSPGPLRISDSPRDVDSPAANCDNVFVPSPSSSLPNLQIPQLYQNISNFMNSEVKVNSSSPYKEYPRHVVEELSREMEMISDVVESETSQETNETIGIGRQRKARQMSRELVAGISVEVSHSPNKNVAIYTTYQREAQHALVSEESTSNSVPSMGSVPPTPGKHLVVPPAPAQTLPAMAVPTSSIAPVLQVPSIISQPSTSRNEKSDEAIVVSQPYVKKTVRNFLQVADILPYKKRKKEIIPEPVRRKQAAKLAREVELDKLQ